MSNTGSSTELTYIQIVPPGAHMPLIGGYSLCSLMEYLNEIIENGRLLSTKISDSSLLHPMLVRMSETITDIKKRVQAACLMLSELENLNIAVIAGEN